MECHAKSDSTWWANGIKIFPYEEIHLSSDQPIGINFSETWHNFLVTCRPAVDPFCQGASQFENPGRILEAPVIMGSPTEEHGTMEVFLRGGVQHVQVDTDWPRGLNIKILQITDEIMITVDESNVLTCPIKVTRSLSPPKFSMFSETHFNARPWSLRPN